jgi:hypothetical protein
MRLPQLGAQPWVQPGKGLIEAGLRQGGEVGGGFGQIGQADDVAPGDPHQFAASEPAQAAAEVIGIGGFEQNGGQSGRHAAGAVRLLQFAAGAELREQRGIPKDAVGCKVAECQNPQELAAELRVLRQANPRVPAGVEQPAAFRLRVRLQRVRQPSRVVHGR